MTDQEINAAIAEACGWSRCIGGLQPKGDMKPRYWRTPECRELRNSPSYCTDLNAMHEAEKAFAADDRDYRRQLASVVKWPYQGALYNATARQRAEAFLRTIGKWEEQ